MADYYVIIEDKLNLTPGMWAPLRVHVKQYDGDYTRQMKFTLYDGENIYEIPSNTKVTVSGTKRDGTGFSYYGAYSGSVVTVPLMRQMTTVYGVVPCEIGLFNSDDNQIASATFVLDVEKAALQSSVLESSNDFQTFQGYVDEAKYYEQLSQSYAIGDSGIRSLENTDNSKFYSLKARSYALSSASYVGSPLTATTASSMTDTSRIYVYIGNESGYTNGNWYYYDSNTSSWKSGGVYNSSASMMKSYTNVDAMKLDATLSAGMTAFVMGNETYSDGYGGTYYVRTLESDETADEYDIISLSDTTLCAEKIDSYYQYVVTPQMYGATGDGVTDDSAAFITALSKHHNVYIPNGTYYFADYIDIPSNVNITSIGATLLFDTATTKRGAEEVNAFIEITNNENISISGVNFKFLGKSNVYTGTDPVSMIVIRRSVNNVKFENCSFLVTDETGVDNTSTCVWIASGNDGCNFISFENCLFRNEADQQEGGCLWVLGNHKNILCINCKFYHSGFDEAVVAWGTNAAEYPEVTMTGCSVEIIPGGSWASAQLIQAYQYGILRFIGGTLNNNGDTSMSYIRAHNNGILIIESSKIIFNSTNGSTLLRVVDDGSIECNNNDITYIHNGTNDRVAFCNNMGGHIKVSGNTIRVSFAKTLTNIALIFFETEQNYGTNSYFTFDNNILYIDPTNTSGCGFYDWTNGVKSYFSNTHDNVFINTNQNIAFKHTGYGEKPTNKIVYNNTYIGITKGDTSLYF